MQRHRDPINGTASSSTCRLNVLHNVSPRRTLRSNSALRLHGEGRMHAPLSTPSAETPAALATTKPPSPPAGNCTKLTAIITIQCRYPLTRRHLYALFTFFERQWPIAISR
ncbi:hypothetical protein PMIN01_12631 [Paraphaeosphaeria minitans]|uniref:Uncharacterized protein n=1 Tax=Paraphaeosphaeria minitans TaxID=565426 RepID=A0A9P6G5D5_9PLEO|nr:hypothetical protein PMIN01_12631 [Paraphaeosphaeria minitans]